MTTPLALQLRAIAARAPQLDRPAIAAAADAVEEVARLRAEIDHLRADVGALRDTIQSIRGMARAIKDHPQSIIQLADAALAKEK